MKKYAKIVVWILCLALLMPGFSMPVNAAELKNVENDSFEEEIEEEWMLGIEDVEGVIVDEESDIVEEKLPIQSEEPAVMEESNVSSEKENKSLAEENSVEFVPDDKKIVMENQLADEEDCIEELLPDNSGNSKVDTIISFALSKKHSAEYSGYCQSFVKACYEAAGIYASVNAGSANEAKSKWMISNDLSNIPLGACVYFISSEGGGWGHVAIYLGNDRIIHTVKGVYSAGDPDISYVEETSLSYYTSRGKIEGWGYQAGYNLYGGSTPSTPSSLLSNTGVNEITNTTAKINAALPSAYNISEAGFYYGTSPENMTKVVEAASGSTINVFYTLGNGKWCGPLSPGTTYYYKIYVVINGMVHETSVDSFTTAGVSSSAFPLVDGRYYYIWNHHAGRFLDSESSAEGARVIINEHTVGKASQKWKAVRHADGYSFVSAATGYAMDVYGYSKDEWTEIKQYAYHGESNQRFQLVDRGGYYSMHPVCSGLALDTHLGEAAAGTHIIQYSYSDINHMKWGFVECDSTAPTISKVWYSHVSNNTFSINATVSDNVGVTAVRFPTWRSDQTGEQAIWLEGTKQPDGTWAVIVDANNWGCMEATYYTHVYAYDAEGNYSSNNSLSIWLDRTPPYGGEVKAERISENIVKVSCYAEDYAADVERVVFPTWTDKNGQDDIAEDWYNNCKGKKEGDRWVWYVNDANHNYEKGTFTTHIYAYDANGNHAYIGGVGFDFENRYQPKSFTYNGNRYEVYDDILTWSQAKAKCEALGGHLVTITSQGEQKAIAEAIQTGVRDGYFMGGTTINGTNTWITGETFGYTNWNPGEPNYTSGINDAYQMYRNTEGTWDDTVAERCKLGFICEYEAPKGFWVEEIGDYIYTGKAIKPTVKVYDGTTLLSANKDYTVAYINNIAVNNASNKKTAPTITVTGKGNYSGNQSIYFKIEPADISGDDFSVNNMTATYTGKKQTPIPKLMWKGKMLEYGKDFYIPEYDNAKNDSKAFKSAGKYQLTVIGKKNFTGTISSTLTISQSKKHIAINKVTVSGIKDVNWTGKQRTQTGFKLNYGNDILSVKNGDFTVSWGTNVDVGTGTVTFRGTGLDTDGDGYCYVGAKSVSFKIKGTSVNDATVSGLKKKYIYTGNQIEPDTILKYKAKNGKTETLVEGVHYKVTYKNNINKGTATITYQGLAKGGFTGTKKVTFEISAKGIATKLVDGNKVKQIEVAFTDTGNMQQGIYIAPYMKGGAKPNIKVTCGDKMLVKGKDYTVSYENNKKVALSTNSALPAVVIKGKGNYSGTYKEPFFIRKKPLLNSNGITVVASDKVVSTKKNGYRQNFKVYDSDGVLLESNDYDTKNVTYTLIKTPDKNGTIIDVNQQLNKNSIVPANSIIRITVRGKGAYIEGEATGTYRILEKGHNISSATIQIKNQTYTGSQILITDQSQFINGKVYVVSGSIKKELVLGKDIEVVPGSYSNNIKAGTAKVKFRGINEYGGVKTVTFKIVSKKIKWL